MHGAKNMNCVHVPIKSATGTDNGQILSDIAEATIREQCRKTQRKAGESLVTSVFVVKLTNSAQWERSKVELRSMLSSIIGAKGVSLVYVIREEETHCVEFPPL